MEIPDLPVRPTLYRLNAKRILLTYPQLDPAFTKEEALSRLRSKTWGTSRLEACLVVLERHKDGTPHLHIATSWTAKLNLHSAQCFDFVTGKFFSLGPGRNHDFFMMEVRAAVVLTGAYRQTWRLPRYQVMAEYHRVPDEGGPRTPGFWDRPPVFGAMQEEMEIWISEGQSRYDSSSIVYWGDDPQRYPQVMLMLISYLLINVQLTNIIQTLGSTLGSICNTRRSYKRFWSPRVCIRYQKRRNHGLP